MTCDYRTAGREVTRFSEQSTLWPPTFGRGRIGAGHVHPPTLGFIWILEGKKLKSQLSLVSWSKLGRLEKEPWSNFGRMRPTGGTVRYPPLALEVRGVKGRQTGPDSEE